MADKELKNVQKPNAQSAPFSISVASEVKECISAIGQEHEAFKVHLLEGGNDSGDKTVRLEGLKISMTCSAKIAVQSDKKTRRYGLKMTSGNIDGPLLEWSHIQEEGPIKPVKTKGKTTLAAIPRKTLAIALCDAMDGLKRKVTDVGGQEPEGSKRDKKSSSHRTPGSRVQDPKGSKNGQKSSPPGKSGSK